MSNINDLLTGQQPSPITLTKREAFAVLALSMARVDGSFGEEEKQYLAWSLMKVKLQEPERPLDFKKLTSMLDTHGPARLIEAAKAVLSPELRETAFALAADLALADRLVQKTEREYLIELYQGLEVAEDVALKIIEVMMIRHRGETGLTYQD
jgi:hypothetical protein